MKDVGRWSEAKVNDEEQPPQHIYHLQHLSSSNSGSAAYTQEGMNQPAHLKPLQAPTAHHAA